MYYFIENNINLQLSSSDKGKLTLTIFKHLLKLIKQLADPRHNWFGLINWDQYRKTQKYVSTIRTLRDYCEKYEREYLIFLKRADINVIKEVNQKLPEFTSSDPFMVPFYRKILNYLIPFIKNCSSSIPPFREEDYNKEVAGQV